ncbi:CarboxypepD_reg-like domain-containing protein [Spirosoma endophyticum]|uniref:CarboxypepD_reg-like domain-containing protein n=1 Tax=Spirosoma endophyticum TaxID=662367 RepID=A0A1I1U3G4_9BACT|nr:CarboxypepD_reg-like domain-containing protein [Spirosoma endophyticum]
MRPLNLLLLLFLIVSYLGTEARAQTVYTVTGLVTDSRTGDPIPFASVALVGRRSGTVSDEKGHYTLTVKILTDSLAVSSLGYKPLRRAIDPERPTQAVDFKLESSGTALQEVTVKAGENPAWRVLRQVRKNRTINDRKRLSAYEYDSYVKTEIALSHVTERMRKNPLIKRINEAMSKQDSIVDDEGHRLLPLLASESVSRYYFRSSPERKREDIRKTRIKGVAVDDAGLSSQLLGGTNLVSQNFYDNYIPILGKDFASPIGDNWKNWYEFFLADTTQIGDHVCYEIHFDPKRPEDLVFIGKAWIDTTSFALCQIETRIGKDANLNYVRGLTIEQELETTVDSSASKTASAGWLPVSIKLTANLTGVGKQSLGMRAQVTLRNSNVVVNRPHPILFYEQPIEPSDTVATTNEAYWHTVQSTLAGADSLSKEDQKAREIIAKLRAVPAVKVAEAIGQVAVTGFLKAGGLDIGPYPYLFAVNSVEGLRTRIGFRTNEQFSRNLVLRGYVAYGTLDAQFKYGAEIDYLFSRQHWTIAGVRIANDLERLGLTPELIGGNRIFYAFSRFGRYRGGYQSYQKEVFFKTEPVKGILLTAMLGSRTFDPLFPFRYRVDPELGDQSTLRSEYNDAYWAVEARLARKEKYLMDGNERITLGTKRAPVLTLRYTRGSKMLGGDFNYDRFTLRAQQTFRLGPLGRTTYLLSAGYTPSTLPAPLLFPHIGNPTPLLTTNTFNRMQFYEFVSDRFVAIHVQHRFEGLLFNRIPGIRKFNWRLIANVDALWGSMSKANEAVASRKPLPDGVRPIYFGALDGNKPYMEVGYGIDNIFKLIRIQAIHRLNYLDDGPNNIPLNSFALKASATISF